MESLPEDAPAPRLCHLFKWPDFDGYGFNLHGEKSKPGQYIGKVDKESPSEVAGLLANDRIIEVNGTNIANENHKQVVQRIKAIPNETKLLVVDDKTEQYYKTRNIVINSDMPNIMYLKTPVPRPMANNKPDDVADDSPAVGNGEAHSDEDGKSHVSDSSTGSSLPSKTDSDSRNDSSMQKDSRNGFNYEDTSSTGPSPTPPGSSASPSPTPILLKTNTLDLNMTAQEMRAMLAARKKEKLDPKNQKIDLRKKYDIIQTL